MPDTEGTEFGSSGVGYFVPTPDATNAPNQNANTNGPKSVAEVARTNWKPGQMWPTPTANEDACGKSTGKMQAMLGNHPDLGKDKTQGSLNPQFVEWLMGYPKDWTAVEDFASGRKKTMKPQELPPE